MVKYTGYGNAAGLLARRGLMLGGKGENAGNYSDEEHSETEEYAENAHKWVVNFKWNLFLSDLNASFSLLVFSRVNPIVGCVEPVRPSPFEGMTDEQKEYEAMKLVNLINDLHNVGVIKPAVPGPDGKPVEVEHVLQLQENLPNVGEVNRQEEEDSD